MKVRTFIIFLIAILVAGCSAPKKNITVLKPPRVESVAGIKKIAVLPFKGDKSITYVIEAKLNNITINGKKYFQLVSRTELDKVLSEVNFQESGLAEKVVEYGKILGVQGIITGFAKPSYWINSFKEKRQKCIRYEDHKCKAYRDVYVLCKRIKAQYVLIPKILKIPTGEIVYSREIKKSDYSKYCYGDHTQPVSYLDMIDRLKEEAVNEFIEDIAPHQTVISIKFKDDDDDIKDRKAKELFNKGLEFLENQDLEKACQFFEKAYQKYSDSISILYNLGACQEIKGNLKEALEYYTKAYDKLSKPDKDIQNAIYRVKTRIKEREKLKRVLN